MGAHSAPDDVRLARYDLVAVRERGPTIRGVGQFSHAAGSLHALDAQRRRKRGRTRTQRGNERRQHGEERALQLARQPTELAVKASEPLERRHLRGAGVGQVILGCGDPLEMRNELLVAEHRALGSTLYVREPLTLRTEDE